MAVGISTMGHNGRQYETCRFETQNYKLKNNLDMKNEIELRDYFAAKVLEGIHSNNDMWVAMCMDKRNCTRDKENDTHEDYVAQLCYKMADAMLKERERQ